MIACVAETGEFKDAMRLLKASGPSVNVPVKPPVGMLTEGKLLGVDNDIVSGKEGG